MNTHLPASLSFLIVSSNFSFDNLRISRCIITSFSNESPLSGF